jgi:F-type H+-transporting ATPase subunit b
LIFKLDFQSPGRSLRTLVLTFLLANCLVPASFVFAQDATPGNRANAGQNSEPSAEKTTEQEETNAYRHSASVHWLANLLHIDDETAAKTFEYINFGVVVLALGIPLGKMLPGVLRKRSAQLRAEIDVAQARTADANERLAAVESKLAGLDAEIAAIRKQVEEEMRNDEVRSKALLEEETARIVAGAEQEIAMAGTQAQRGLRQFAADLAIDRAVSQLSIDADTDRALFAEFASDIAGTNGQGKQQKAAKGGQD